MNYILPGYIQYPTRLIGRSKTDGLKKPERLFFRPGNVKLINHGQDLTLNAFFESEVLLSASIVQFGNQWC